MHVILDSNIYLGDPKFQGQVNILADYLKDTGGSVVLPNIVLAETEVVYERQLQSATEKYIEYSKDVKRLASNLIFPIVDVSTQVSDFVKRIKSFPQDAGRLTVELSVEDVLSLTIQAARRVRPFNSEGHGFRDAAIWLTVLRHATENPDVTVAFISRNWTEFGQSKQDKTLHSELYGQLKAKGLSNVIYFESVTAFLEQQLVKTESIDLSSIPDALLGTHLQLERFRTKLENILFGEGEDRASGLSLGVWEVETFVWNLKSVRAYNLAPNEIYIIAEVNKDISVNEYRLVAVHTDYDHDETYEDYDEFPMGLSLDGRLSLTVKDGILINSELISIDVNNYFELEDEPSNSKLITEVEDLPF